MAYALENEILTIFADGRIESTNAEAVMQEWIALCEEKQHDALIIDAEKLEYISSSGLRIFMKLRKQEKDMHVINVSHDVYDVFEMTGFTQLFPIEKALRIFSVEDCEMIGEGGFGKVYRVSPETIIKVFRPEMSFDYVRRERESAHIALIRGLPTAISFDVVRVGESYGVMYELFEADNLSYQMRENPDELDEYVKQYAELGKQIHTTELEEGELQPVSTVFTSTFGDLGRWMSDEEIEHVKALVEAIPKRNTLVHGDFHPKNIMVNNGELELIDMGDLSQGHPFVEIGIMYISHIQKPERALEMTPEFSKVVWDKFLQCYFGEIDADTMKEFEALLEIIAMLRKFPFACTFIKPGDKPELEGYINGMKQSLLNVSPKEFHNQFEKLGKKLL